MTKLQKLRGSLILATVLACRTSAESSKAEILKHLREIQREHRTSDHANGKLDATIQALTVSFHQQANGKLEAVHSEVQDCLNQFITLHRDLLKPNSPQNLESAILGWLDFRQISWRFEEVREAHRETYQWIFENSGENQKRADFTTYLEKDQTVPYFINGKAGSGKSTLMKFIYNHPKTTTALKGWAGPEELVVLNFFFWNLGTNLQKSHVGMLRALLHEMLQRHPELIPAVLPRLYRNWRSSDTESEPVYIEMKQAFELMIKKTRFLKLAIFIDGIDELDGNHRDMALFLRSLTSHHVKIIVSSRPLNECLATFYNSPTLRLQDLTRNDMTSFVQNEFLSHHLVVRLMEQLPRKALRIAEDIVEKAEGIFLWVTIVVRLLLQGLENGDNLDELQAVLTSLPPDLRALYKIMIGKMRIEHQIQASEMFQIMQKWNEKVRDKLLPVYVVSCALGPPSAMVDIPVAQIKYGNFDWTLTSLGNRIRSRCCGLLEVYYPIDPANISRDEPIANDKIDLAVVNYLHRTVSEFLKASEVWQEVCALTNGTPFEAATSLTSACLIMLKADTYPVDMYQYSYLMKATVFWRDSKNMTADLKLLFIRQMDSTMDELRQKFLGGPFADPVHHWSSNAFVSGRIVPRLRKNRSVHVFLAYHGISFPMTSIGSSDDRSIQSDILFGTLESWTRGHLLIEEKQEALSFFLGNVPSEGEEMLQESLRDYGLLICNELLNDRKYSDLGELFKTILRATKSATFLFDGDVKEPNQHISVAWARVLRGLGPQCENTADKRFPARCGDSLWAAIQQLVSKAEAERNEASKSFQQTQKSQKHRKKSRRARKE